jgi:hypothetical protein
VAEDVREAAATHAGNLQPRASAMRLFANGSHGAVAEAAQRLTGGGAKRAARTLVVPEIFLQPLKKRKQIFLVPAPGGAAGLPCRAIHVGGSKRVDG